MTISDEITYISEKVKKLTATITQLVLAGNTHGTSYEGENIFDKLSNGLPHNMKMEEVAEFALTSKVILSYIIDFLNSFHDQLMKGLWERSSNGYMYPLDKSYEKVLYVEINENYEVDSEKLVEELRNGVAPQMFDEMSQPETVISQKELALACVHKVFDEISESVLCSNQDQNVPSVDETNACEEDDGILIDDNKFLRSEVLKCQLPYVRNENVPYVKSLYELSIPTFMIEMAQAAKEIDNSSIGCDYELGSDDKTLDPPLDQTPNSYGEFYGKNSYPNYPYSQISRPEDWERTLDLEEYVVEFFGTQEVAFVSPTDIQAFTRESKTKLLAKCKGKTLKYFAQGVKEICEAFEELQKHGDFIESYRPDLLNLSDAKFNLSHSEVTKVLKSEELREVKSVLDGAYLFSDSVMGDKQTAAMKDIAADIHKKIKLKKEFDSFSPGHVQTKYKKLLISDISKELYRWGILDLRFSFGNGIGTITYDMMISYELGCIGSLPKFELYFSIFICRLMIIGACCVMSTVRSNLVSSPTLEDKGDFRGVEDTSKECNWESNRLVLWFYYITNKTRKGVGFLTYVFDSGGLYWQINVLDGQIIDSSKELCGDVLHYIPFMVSLPCVLCAQFREGFDKVYGVNKGQNSNDIFWTKKVTCASQIIVWSVWSGKLILVKHIGRVRIRRTITLMKHVNLELAWKILHDQQLASILKETKLLSLMTEIIKIRARLEWRPGISLENDKQSPNDTIFVFDPGGSHIVKRCLDEPTGSLRTRII